MVPTFYFLIVIIDTCGYDFAFTVATAGSMIGKSKTVFSLASHLSISYLRIPQIYSKSIMLSSSTSAKIQINLERTYTEIYNCLCLPFGLSPFSRFFQTFNLILHFLYATNLQSYSIPLFSVIRQNNGCH